MASATARLVVAALAVDEEDVVAELRARGPRLDLDEVDAAEGELRQAAHEPARACRRRRRRRRSTSSSAPPSAAGGNGSAPRGAPARRSASRCPASSSMPSRRTTPPCSSAATREPIAAIAGGAVGEAADRLGGRAGRRPAARRGSCSRRKRAHCASPCGCERTVVDRVERDVGSRAIRHWRHRQHLPRRRSRRRGSALSASTVALTVPSSEFSIGTSARVDVAGEDRGDRLAHASGRGRARRRRCAAARARPPP